MRIREAETSMKLQQVRIDYDDISFRSGMVLKHQETQSELEDKSANYDAVISKLRSELQALI